MDFKTLRELFYYSTATYSKNKCFCTLGGDFYTYEQLGQKTEEVSALLLNNQVKFGDKVGILSQNMPNWGVAFFSCAAYGRVAVPMLPDFSEGEISNILEHSEAKALFISKKLFRKLSEQTKEKLQTIIEIDDFTVLKGENIYSNPADTEKVINGEKSVTAKELHERINELKEDLSAGHFAPQELDLATIIYTSGTTGNSKGVMLTHKNLCSHLKSAMQLRPSFEWDVWLSILPLSHTLECSLSLLLPFVSGSSVYYLEKAPTPTMLMQALKTVRPTTLLVVPLIIEKIYKSSILPKIKSKKITAALYKTTIGRKVLHRIIGKQMVKMFGGRMRFFGIGGAKVDGTVERFLHEARFPYAIGYGLTECCPLLAGAIPSMVKWQTTGPAVPGVTLRIDNVNPETGEGEIVAKGDNIMAGYFKNPEATAEAFTKDGWFRTKDLGYIDKQGWLSIRGRLNNMIVGPSGENIYPEEIETVINSHTEVAESLVTSEKGKLVAKVFPSPEKTETFNKMKEDLYKAYMQKKVQLIKEYEHKKAEYIKAYTDKKGEYSKAYEIKKSEFTESYNQKRRELYQAYAVKRDEAMASYQEKKNEVIEVMNRSFETLSKEVHEYVNARVNKFSRVTKIQVQQDEFKKTATQKIKRYLYK